MELVQYIALAIMAIAAWGAICNFQTHAQKKALLDLISAEAKMRIVRGEPLADWLNLYEAMDRVTYDQHLIANMLFRDPLKLYPPELQALAKRHVDGQSPPLSLIE